MRDKISLLAAIFLFAAVLLTAAFVWAADAPNPPDIHRQFMFKTTDADAPVDIAAALAVDAEGNAFVTGYSLIEQRLVAANDDDTVNDAQKLISKTFGMTATILDKIFCVSNIDAEVSAGFDFFGLLVQLTNNPANNTII